MQSQGKGKVYMTREGFGFLIHILLVFSEVENAGGGVSIGMGLGWWLTLATLVYGIE